MRIKEINVSNNEVIEVFENLQQVKNSVFGWLDVYKTVYEDQDNNELIKNIEDFEKIIINMKNLNLNIINENMEFLTDKIYKIDNQEV